MKREASGNAGPESTAKALAGLVKSALTKGWARPYMAKNSKPVPEIRSRREEKRQVMR